MSVRSDLDAASVALVGSLPDSDIAIVLRESRSGTEDTVAEAVRAQVLLELGSRRSEGIPVPRELATAEQQRAWRAAAERAAEQSFTARAPAPPLDEALPFLLKEFGRRADEAASGISSAREAELGAEEAVETFRQRALLHFARAERSPAIRKAIFRWRLVEVATWVAEGLVVSGAFASYFGLFDAPSLSAIPPQQWVQVLSASVPAVLTAFALAMGAGWLLKKMGPGRRLLPAAGAALVVGIAAFALALGVLRWSASLSPDSVTPGTASLGSTALLVLVTVASLVAAGIAVAVRLTLVQLHERLARARKDEEYCASEGARLRDAHDRAAQQRILLEERASTPSRLRTEFEQAVALIGQRLREEAKEAERRVAQARSAFRYVSRLSPVLQEALSAELYELRTAPREGAVQRGGATRNRRSSNGAGRGAFPLVLIVGAGLVAGAATGCGNPPQPRVRILACDGTGKSPEKVCTPALVAESFIDWANASGRVPGSAYQVVTSAGSFGDTEVHQAVRPAAAYHGDARLAALTWKKESLSRVGAIPIPREDSGADVNRSDLISLLLVSVQQAREYPQAKIDLVLASDGWLISLGFNAERDVMPAKQVLARLERDGIAWDLSAFSSVTVCGFHNDGTTAARAAQRDRLWKELLALGRAPQAVIRASCEGVFPPVPDSLRTAPAGSGAGPNAILAAGK